MPNGPYWLEHKHLLVTQSDHGAGNPSVREANLWLAPSRILDLAIPRSLVFEIASRPACNLSCVAWTSHLWTSCVKTAGPNYHGRGSLPQTNQNHQHMRIGGANALTGDSTVL